MEGLAALGAERPYSDRGAAQYQNAELATRRMRRGDLFSAENLLPPQELI